MICLWRITPSRKSRHAFFFPSLLLLSPFVATSFETRGTCKPSAIGSEANLKRGTSSTVFCRWSYYAARFEPPATRSFFHASPVLSRSSIFFASFSLAFLALLAYFFALLSLTCFPSLYCTDTNDGIESSTFSCFISYLFVLFFFLYGMELVNFLNFSIAYILLLFLFYYYIFVRFERSVFNFDHHCQIILVLLKGEFFLSSSSGFVKIKILELLQYF